jgi:hypothetical protein
MRVATVRPGCIGLPVRAAAGGLSGRDFTLETTIDIRSDSTALHVSVTRCLTRRREPLREKRWQEARPRDDH